MYIEWTNPDISTNNDVELRVYVKDLHDKMISTGTGITWMSDIPGQFDFVNEVVPSTNNNLNTCQSKPLYYVYKSTNNIDLYLTLRFHNGVHSSSTISQYFSSISTTNQLVNGVPSSTNILKFNSNEQLPTKFFNTMPYNYSNNTKFTSIIRKSYIVNNDGFLMIIGNIGYSENNANSISRPLVFLMLSVNNKGYDRITPNSSQYFYNYNAYTPNNGYIYINLYYFNVINSIVYYNTIDTTVIKESKMKNFVQLKHFSFLTGVKDFKYVYYYSNINNNYSGIQTINNKKYLFFGDMLRHYIINDNTYSLCIEVKD